MPILLPDEVKTAPAYTLEDAAHYVGASPTTLRTWFRGRPAYSTKKGAFRRAAIPAILPTEAGPREPLSFIDLMEAHVLFEIRRVYKFPMKKIKVAMKYLAEQLDGNLSFMAHRDFYHDRTDLFLGEDKTLLCLTQSGQLADPTILADGLRQISYGADGFADEFYPKMGTVDQRQFFINPSINYGRICLVRLGVGAEALAARYKSGEKMYEIAEDYGATTEEIVEAIRWHDRLAA